MVGGLQLQVTREPHSAVLGAWPASTHYPIQRTHVNSLNLSKRQLVNVASEITDVPTTSTQAVFASINDFVACF